MAKTTRNLQPRYPWERWFKKKSFSIQKGKDYHCKPHGMAQQIRNHAAALGFSVSIQISDGGEIKVETRKD